MLWGARTSSNPLRPAPRYSAMQPHVSDRSLSVPCRPHPGHPGLTSQPVGDLYELLCCTAVSSSVRVAHRHMQRDVQRRPWVLTVHARVVALATRLGVLAYSCSRDYPQGLQL